MQHAILKTRTSRAHWFRVCWTRIDYACREANGSLKPVPPGTTRRKLYCRHCKAANCLFGGNGKKSQSIGELLTEWARQEAEELEKRRQKYQQDLARKRARGLDTSSQPLKQTCWNCCELRVKLAGYVCRFEPEAKPASRGQLMHRYAEKCQSFGRRREVAIPPLDGNE